MPVLYPREEKVAVYLRTLDGFRGEARLYRVSPPIVKIVQGRYGNAPEDYYEYEYVVVDADIDLAKRKSVAIYGSEPEGKEVNWFPLVPVIQSTSDHAYALNVHGYRVTVEEDLDIMSKAWVQRWVVTGTSGKEYTVAQKEDGSFGCDCPSWIFQKNKPRRDCQHILMKRIELGAIAVPATNSPTPGKVQRSTKRSIRLED